MNILGLNIGHNATACLVQDGVLVGCTSEERFARIKNYAGIPRQSIDYLLTQGKIQISDIDYVVLDDQYDIDEDPNFGKRFLEAYTKKPFSKRVLSWTGYHFPGLFSRYARMKNAKFARTKESRHLRLKRDISRALQLPVGKILVIEHHLAHSLSPCFNLPRDKNTLIFTLDGEGSGLCATVGIFDGRELRTIAKSPKSASLGYLYSIATMYLGMKPLEHEFKVMGLAPYAKEHSVKAVHDELKKLIWIDDDLVFHSAFNMPFSDHFFFEKMKFKRFDTIAAAVQKLVEELTCEWVSKAVQKTGISDIALAGGVFMNVKANLRISELKEVKKLFVMPSCGDESNPIGCCWFGYDQYCRKNGIKFSPSPFTDLYLGPEYNEKYIKEFFKKENIASRYTIKKVKDINRKVAQLLAQGEIVARCSGRSEWGARALGNRSILANPAHGDTIRILNETIKDRDFWMPFTPSMLDSAAERYLKNPKKIFAPYMTITFESTPVARAQLPAAMHPYDFTIRPQVVTKKYNPDYYALIKEFERLTGTGAVLNTSFNLHGEPNVLTPKDAIHTVDNSSLKYLALGDYLLEKK